MESETSSPTSLFVSIKEFGTSHSSAMKLGGLAGILLFSFWVGMSPRWDYAYPLHVDEWIHIGLAQGMLEERGLEFSYPYSGGQVSFHKEMGFHVLLGFLKSMTGAAWFEIFRIAPGLMLALLSFLAYAYGQRGGFGWAAALFVPLIPTSVQTLGPAFLVPVSAAMLFIPVTLMVLQGVRREDKGVSLWVLLILIGGALFIHPTTEAVITTLAVLFLVSFVVVAFAQRQYREGAGLIMAAGIRVLIPVLVLVLWLPDAKGLLDDSISTGSGGLADLGTNSGFLEAFGVVAVAVAVIGIFFFIARREYGAHGYILPIFTILLLTFLILFPVYSLGSERIYYRGWSYLGLLLSIFAGYGIALYWRSIPLMASFVGIKLQGKPSSVGWVKTPLWGAGIGVIILILIMGLPDSERRADYAGYYHVINDPIFEDFRWIAQHTPPTQMVAMLEPSLGWAYPPSAGPGERVFHAQSFPFTNPTTEKLREMLSSGEVDVAWLRGRGVSLFYDCLPQTFECQDFSNDELFKVRQGVYLVSKGD